MAIQSSKFNNSEIYVEPSKDVKTEKAELIKLYFDLKSSNQNSHEFVNRAVALNLSLLGAKSGVVVENASEDLVNGPFSGLFSKQLNKMKINKNLYGDGNGGGNNPVALFEVASHETTHKQQAEVNESAKYMGQNQSSFYLSHNFAFNKMIGVKAFNGYAVNKGEMEAFKNGYGRTESFLNEAQKSLGNGDGLLMAQVGADKEMLDGVKDAHDKAEHVEKTKYMMQIPKIIDKSHGVANKIINLMNSIENRNKLSRAEINYLNDMQNLFEIKDNSSEAVLLKALSNVFSVVPIRSDIEKTLDLVCKSNDDALAGELILNFAENRVNLSQQDFSKLFMRVLNSNINVVNKVFNNSNFVSNVDEEVLAKNLVLNLGKTDAQNFVQNLKNNAKDELTKNVNFEKISNAISTYSNKPICTVNNEQIYGLQQVAHLTMENYLASQKVSSAQFVRECRGKILDNLSNISSHFGLENLAENKEYSKSVKNFVKQPFKKQFKDVKVEANLKPIAFSEEVNLQFEKGIEYFENHLTTKQYYNLEETVVDVKDLVVSLKALNVAIKNLTEKINEVNQKSDCKALLKALGIERASETKPKEFVKEDVKPYVSKNVFEIVSKIASNKDASVFVKENKFLISKIDAMGIETFDNDNKQSLNNKNNLQQNNNQQNNNKQDVNFKVDENKEDLTNNQIKEQSDGEFLSNEQQGESDENFENDDSLNNKNNFYEDEEDYVNLVDQNLKLNENNGKQLNEDKKENNIKLEEVKEEKIAEVKEEKIAEVKEDKQVEIEEFEAEVKQEKDDAIKYKAVKTEYEIKSKSSITAKNIALKIIAIRNEKFSEKTKNYSNESQLTLLKDADNQFIPFVDEPIKTVFNKSYESSETQIKDHIENEIYDRVKGCVDKAMEDVNTNSVEKAINDAIIDKENLKEPTDELNKKFDEKINSIKNLGKEDFADAKISNETLKDNNEALKEGNENLEKMVDNMTKVETLNQKGLIEINEQVDEQLNIDKFVNDSIEFVDVDENAENSTFKDSVSNLEQDIINSGEFTDSEALTNDNEIDAKLLEEMEYEKRNMLMQVYNSDNNLEQGM